MRKISTFFAFKFIRFLLSVSILRTNYSFKNSIFCSYFYKFFRFLDCKNNYCISPKKGHYFPNVLFVWVRYITRSQNSPVLMLLTNT